MEENQTRLDKLEDYSAALEVDIQITEDHLHEETDETHIIFLTDHLNMLKFDLDKTNAEIYLFRRKIKFAENQTKFQHQWNSD